MVLADDVYFQFHPQTFEIELDDPADEELIEEFVGLQSRGLQTWVAIGGYDFSDPGSTRTAWSDMASTQDGRSHFIQSLKSFMDKWGFQGVDLGRFILRYLDYD